LFPPGQISIWKPTFNSDPCQAPIFISSPKIVSSVVVGACFLLKIFHEFLRSEKRKKKDDPAYFESQRKHVPSVNVKFKESESGSNWGPGVVSKKRSRKMFVKASILNFEVIFVSLYQQDPPRLFLTNRYNGPVKSSVKPFLKKIISDITQIDQKQRALLFLLRL